MTPLPVSRAIDPRGLTPAQRAGERCGYPNCRRHLTEPKTLLGALADSTPIFVCDDHDSPTDPRIEVDQ